jgi:hypothetical protein
VIGAEDFLGHAIHTTKVTSVSHGYSQVTQGTVEGINKGHFYSVSKFVPSFGWSELGDGQMDATLGRHYNNNIRKKLRQLTERLTRAIILFIYYFAFIFKELYL